MGRFPRRLQHALLKAGRCGLRVDWESARRGGQRRLPLERPQDPQWEEGLLLRTLQYSTAFSGGNCECKQEWGSSKRPWRARMYCVSNNAGQPLMLARPGPCKKIIAQIVDMLTYHGSPIEPDQGLKGSPCWR